jgi:hypothetical protein
MNDELERTTEEEVVACFKGLLRNSPGVTKKNKKETSGTILGGSAGPLTGYLWGLWRRGDLKWQDHLIQLLFA